MKTFVKSSFIKSLFGIFLAVILLDIFIWRTTKNFVLDEIKYETNKKINLARELIPDSLLLDPNFRMLKEKADEIKGMTSDRFTLIDKYGRVVADSEIEVKDLSRVENHLMRPEVQEAFRSSSGLAMRRSATIDKDLIYYCEKISQKGRIVGFMRFAVFADGFTKKMFLGKNLIFIVDLIILLTFILGYFIYSRNLLKQFDRLTAAINKMSADKKREIEAQKYSEFDNIYGSVHSLCVQHAYSEKQLKNILDQRLSLLNSLDSGIAAFDNNEELIFANDKFISIMEIGQRAAEKTALIDWLRFPPLTKDISGFKKKKKVITRRAKYYGHKFVEYSISPLIVHNGKKKGFIITVKDVTHLQNLETIRQDFVANVSHEFKTPLTSIHGYAETLLSTADIDDNTRDKFLNKIYRQTAHLENIVSDLLKLNRIEQSGPAEFKPIDPFIVIPEIVSEFNSQNEHKNILIVQEIENPKTPVLINADNILLNNIILNLLSNAVQYGGDKPVIFRMKTEGQKLAIEVEDKGIGIPPKEQTRIFERFYRLTKAREIYSEGSGLGLSIVKHTVNLLGGEISLTSSPDEGSLFKVGIPFTS